MSNLAATGTQNLKMRAFHAILSFRGGSGAGMVSRVSARATRWGPGLIINVLALSLASYLAMVYYHATTRRVLAEYVLSSLVLFLVIILVRGCH